jgi:inorganic pyrophosphatase
VAIRLPAKKIEMVSMSMDQVQNNISFWQEMNQLVITNLIILDRPKGSTHPRYPDVIYPFDYGYLENTTASDGGGIDVWVGSLKIAEHLDGDELLTGILCTFDTLKRDAEIKLLIGCTKEDVEIIQNFHSEMRTLFIPNPTVDS